MAQLGSRESCLQTTAQTFGCRATRIVPSTSVIRNDRGSESRSGTFYHQGVSYRRQLGANQAVSFARKGMEALGSHLSTLMFGSQWLSNYEGYLQELLSQWQEGQFAATGRLPITIDPTVELYDEMDRTASLRAHEQECSSGSTDNPCRGMFGILRR